MCAGDFRKAFILAQMFKDAPLNLSPDEKKLYLEGQADGIFKRWIRTQHKFAPLTHRPWMKVARDGQRVIHHLVMGLEQEYPDYPLVLWKDIQAEFQQKSKDAIKRVKDQLVATIAADIGASGPDWDKIRSGEPQDWVPKLDRLPGQALESHDEQCRALQNCIDVVKESIDECKNFVPGRILVGPPGAGKTHILKLVVAYCLSRGLNVGMMSLMAERALEMGGQNMHQFFCMREVAGQKTITSARLADSTLFNLESNPIKKDILRSCHVLCFEEIGLISQEYLSAIDMILRGVRENELPFGGVIFFATGDPRQLPPIIGRPMWISSHMFSSFRPVVLRHYVRSMNDLQLQRALRLLQLPRMTAGQVEECIEVFSNNLHAQNFVETFQDAPADSIKIVSKNKVVQQLAKEAMGRRKHVIDDHNQRFPAQQHKCSCISHADDFVETTPGHYGAPDHRAKQDLNRLLEEQDELFLSEGGVYKFSTNDTGNTPMRFTHGQLCIVKKIHKPG